MIFGRLPLEQSHRLLTHSYVLLMNTENLRHDVMGRDVTWRDEMK